MILILVAGIMMDKFGRKWIISVMAVGWCISMTLLPVVAPSKLLYIVLVICQNITVIPVTFNPLIQDYVAKESIGRATAI